MAAMVKLERLLNLFTVLMQATRPLTRDEIRATLPQGAYSTDEVAFLRTFDRDKNDLRDLGVELLLAPAPNEYPPKDGYWIDREAYGVVVPVLDAEESTSLALATAIVRIDPNFPGVPVWLLEDGAGSGGVVAELQGTDIPSGPDVHRLMRAVTERHVVDFDYRGEKRTVEPHRLVFAKGRWQLTGHDRLRDAVRQFRSDRIEGEVTVSDETFDQPEATREVEIDHAWRFDGQPAGAEDPLTVRIRVDARHVAWVEGFLGGDVEIERADDGTAIVSEQVRDLAAFRSFVLTFLDGAEVIGPAEARADMVAWLEAMAGVDDGSDGG